MDASQILVVILATTLAIFLVLAIVLVVILINIAKQIQRVTDTVERTAVGFEKIVGNVQKTVAPAFVARFVLDQIKRFTGNHDKRKR